MESSIKQLLRTKSRIKKWMTISVIVFLLAIVLDFVLIIGICFWILVGLLVALILTHYRSKKAYSAPKCKKCHTVLDLSKPHCPGCGRKLNIPKP